MEIGDGEGMLELFWLLLTADLAWDKLLWVLARRFCAGWSEHLRIVTPDTIVRWHRQGWRLFWRWKARSRGGRLHLSAEVQELIMTMSARSPPLGRRLIC